MNNSTKIKEISYPKKERIYIDITLTNPIDDDLGTQPVNFDVTYNQTILKNCDRYKFTVARLSVPASDIPLFIDDGLGVTGNSSLYSVSLRYSDIGITGIGTNTEQVFLNFDVPIERLDSLSAGPIQAKSVYTINTFVQAMNSAFQTAFENIISYSWIVPPNAVVAPFFTWNNSTLQLTLNVDERYNSAFAGQNVIEIWVNQGMTSFLPSLNYIYPITIPSLTGGLSAQLNIVDIGDNRDTFQFPLDSSGIQTPRGSLVNSLTISQGQGNFLNSISKLSKIHVYSSSFNPRKQVENSFTNNLNNNYIERSNIFDLTPDFLGSSITESFIYTPSLYRWSDIQCSDNLNTVQFQLYFEMHNGIFPLKMGIGNVFNIKLLFETADFIEPAYGFDINSQIDDYQR